MFVGLILSCNLSSPTADDPASRAAAPAPELDLARPEPEWVARRVAAARERLHATEAGRRLWQAIEAHGGLTRWYSSGPLAFRFAYRPLPSGGRAPRDTRQVVDPWSARAVHERSDQPGVRFGWDGAQAWQIVPEGEELGFSARFWALTPYYFVGMPFVLADDGVNLEALPPATLEDRPCERIKATFEAGTGDAPDDFYVLYLARDDQRLVALRYVVSYPGFFEGGGHGPEKLMTYDAPVSVAGIQLASAHRTFAWTGDERGELVTRIAVSELAFRPDLPAAAFAVPAGAEILSGW